MVALDVCVNALRTIGVFSQGAPPADGDIVFALANMNRMFDQWNAMRWTVPNDVFQTFDVPVNVNPLTIGPNTPTVTPNLVTTIRPVEIKGANWILADDVRVAISIRDAEWSFATPTPAIASSLPTDLYYRATWPHGEIVLWPVLNTVYPLELWLRAVLGNLAISDTFDLAPGYEDAVTLTLAERLIPSFGLVSRAPGEVAEIKRQALEARAIVFGGNEVTPQIRLTDSGMPSQGSGRPYFNWMTGNLAGRRS